MLGHCNDMLEHFGAMLGLLGPMLGHFGAMLAHFRVILHIFCVMLEPSWCQEGSDGQNLAFQEVAGRVGSLAVEEGPPALQN